MTNFRLLVVVAEHRKTASVTKGGRDAQIVIANPPGHNHLLWVGGTSLQI